MIIVAIFARIVGVIAERIVEHGAEVSTWQGVAWVTAASQAGLALFVPVQAIAPSVIYNDLVVGKEGANVEDLAAVFD
jgi:hypothetical protein